MIEDGNLEYDIPIDKILFIQSEHVYVRIHLSNQQSILQRKSLSVLEKELTAKNFLRVHRSYLVNLQAMTRFGHRLIVIGNHEIAVGRSYWKTVTDTLENWSSR